MEPAVSTSAVQHLLNDKKYDDAYTLAKQTAEAAGKDGTPEADFVTAQAELVKTQLSLRRTHEALAGAESALKRYPENPRLHDILGEVHFKRGEIPLAALSFEASLKLDPCSAQTHYDVARYNHLNSQFLSEQKQLNVAHKLAPHNERITHAWEASESAARPLSERLRSLDQQLTRTDLSPAERASLERHLAILQSVSKGSCSITHPTDKAVLPLTDVGLASSYSGTSIGLKMSFNDKPATLQLDTGASGISISQSVAKAAGLITEAQVSAYGIGSAKDMPEDLAHVDKLLIGGLEFHNCLVSIMRQDRLHQDGLIGSDVFSSWIVTIDTSRHQLRLSPLPALPGEKVESAALEATGNDAHTTPRNRYTPPELKDWTPVFRQGHNLLFSTAINDGAPRLFIMDTGASAQGLISIAAAREATHLGDGVITVRGISGAAEETMDAEDYTLTFAHVRDQYQHVPALNLYRLSTEGGAEVSGLIGFSTLQKLVISIDYRDSLVHALPIAKSSPNTP